MKLENKPYGVWNMATRNWEEPNLDYKQAMGLALFCCSNDDIGAKNFAVIACTDVAEEDMEPIWHEMVWHGAFQGYDWLYQHCVEIGEITDHRKAPETNHS